MRSVIFGLNISLDGCYDHDNPQFITDEELHDYFTDMMREVDLDVYGRITYELMFPYWADVAKTLPGPPAINEFAKAITAMDKIVFSRTLTSVGYNTRIMRDNLEDEIRKLKQLPGKKIAIGGVDLGKQLMVLGLIDEFYFVLHPVITGEGKRLMEGQPLLDKLKLVETKIFKSGCVGLHYVRE